MEEHDDDDDDDDDNDNSSCIFRPVGSNTLHLFKDQPEDGHTIRPKPVAGIII